MAKSGQLCGSKLRMEDKDRDLFKRRYSMIFTIALFTIFILLFLAATATPASAAVSYTLEGWTLAPPHPGWTTGSVKDWPQGGCIPYRYTVENTGGDPVLLNLEIEFSHKDDGIIGIEDFENFVVPAGSIIGPTLNGNGFYWWDVTVPGGTTYILTWCARLSNEAGLWPGASIHVRAGGRDVPIHPGFIKMPDLYVTKTATVSCDAISYTINYGNSGDADQTGTTLVDDYDETKVTVTNAGGGTDNGDTITWDIGTVVVGGTGSVSYTVSINEGVANGAEIINSGTISGDLAEENTDNNHYSVTSYAKVSPVADAGSDKSISAGGSVVIGGSPTASGGKSPYTYSWTPTTGLDDHTIANPIASPTSTTTYTVTVTDANLCTGTDSMTVYISECTVTKTPSVSTAKVGETITYSFTVTNSGDTTLSGLTLTDSKLGTITLDKTTLAPLETASSTGGPYTHTVVEGDLPGPLTNTATASSTDSLGNPVTCADDASVELTYGSECTVTKTPSVSTAKVGETITYSFTVTNTGDTTLSGLTLTDSMLGTITLDKTTLAPLETASSTGGPYTHTVVEGDLPGPLTNTATASSTDSQGNPVTCADDASVELTYGSECTVTKTPDKTTAKVGETITYSFTVTNSGDTTLSGLTLTDSMLGTITLDKTTLAPLETASSTGGPYTHTVVEGDLPGPLTNTATASSTDSQGNPVTCADDASVELTYGSECTVTKTPDKTTAKVGENITYSFTVTNSGDTTLSGLTLQIPCWEQSL
uniref:DUF11 domain-containing protein n=1 Tax=Candidatus Methanophaga sp. ANME-1 ERB7 TaxID=2759913 RepID=A0A7G9Z5L7_9EURY|nr:hypothetical protein JEPGKGNF_00013 [Methanosarcinales archaeon ANME-1 ERB7]